VRSVVGERADFKILDDGTEIVERKWRDLVINFDEKGALPEETWYELSGNVRTRKTCFKGDKGQEVEVRDSPYAVEAKMV
jgi:hypothetical protein